MNSNNTVKSEILMQQSDKFRRLPKPDGLKKIDHVRSEDLTRQMLFNFLTQGGQYGW
jgi:hypothetical protein